MIKYIVGISLLAVILISACSKSSIIGSEILTGDSIKVSFSDSTTFKTLNAKADSARTYPLNSQVFLLGSIDDAIFGNVESEVFTQFAKIFDVPDLENTVLDSVVLSLSTSPTAFWGDSSSFHTMEVFELDESLESYDSIYTNQKFQKGILIGSKFFNPSMESTSTVIYDGDTTELENIIRLRLDNSFGDKFFSNPDAMNNDTLIKEVVNGLVLKSTAEVNSVFGMNNGVYLDEFTNKIIFYYTKEDTLRESHSISLGGKRGVLFDNDFSTSMVNDFFGNSIASDSLLFISGMQGTNFSIEIPYLDALKDDVLINFASIEFYVAELDEDLGFDKVEQIDAYNINDDGTLNYVYDLSIAAAAGGGIPAFFDGYIQEEELESGLVLSKYKINITSELKQRIEEENTSTPILIVPHYNLSRAQRSVIYGPGHGTYPAKLKVTYTEK